jgi:hypothetical protein
MPGLVFGQDALQTAAALPLRSAQPADPQRSPRPTPRDEFPAELERGDAPVARTEEGQPSPAMLDELFGEAGEEEVALPWALAAALLLPVGGFGAWEPERRRNSTAIGIRR